MPHLNKRFSMAFLALALLAGSAAQAGPAYRVSVDTGAHGGQALVDVNFIANAWAPPASATLTNFYGAYGATYERSPGVAGSFAQGIVLGNRDGGRYLTRFVTLGGLFGFDIRFDGDFATTEGIDETLFSATLYNEDFSGQIGNPGSFASFALMPRLNGVAGGVGVLPGNGMASVTRLAEVAEPSSLALALGALAMLGLARRRPAQYRSGSRC